MAGKANDPKAGVHAGKYQPCACSAEEAPCHGIEHALRFGRLRNADAIVEEPGNYEPGHDQPENPCSESRHRRVWRTLQMGIWRTVGWTRYPRAPVQTIDHEPLCRPSSTNGSATFAAGLPHP